MSLHRRAAKRDKNEGAIIKALEANGCIVWPLSSKGIPDLLVFYRRKRGDLWNRQHTTFVADVKGPKEKPTPAQVEKWTALTNLGFSVFILRTSEDAVSMLNNALQPWEPASFDVGQSEREQMMGKPPSKMRARANQQRLAAGMSINAAISGNYTPPRSKPVDAAKEAEATFAPSTPGGFPITSEES
jgi:hypothetical protein